MAASISEKVNARRRGNLSDYLESIREQRGISLRVLAKEAGVNASSMCRWREGKQMPSPESCKIIAEFLSLPIQHIFAMAGYLRPLHRDNIDSVS